MSDSQNPLDAVRIGIVSVSDRASSGVYQDQGLPALQEWLGRALKNPISFEARLIPDEQQHISDTLIELVDAGCSLVLTTGGTGPALRDVTPEATLAIAHKKMPGFGEQMRQIRKDAPAAHDATVAESQGAAPRKSRAYRELFLLVRAQLAAERGAAEENDAAFEEMGNGDDE